MMHNKIGQILKKEMREMIRDKKSLSMMLIVPLMIPLLVFGMSALFEAQMNRPIEDYNKIGFNYQPSDVEKKMMDEIGIDPVYEKVSSLKKKYEEQAIDLYVTKDGHTYTIHGTSNETTTLAASLVESYLSTYKEYLQQHYLEAHEVAPQEVIQILQIEMDVSEEENFFASYIVNYAFLFIIMAITISATYPATDTTAGEKERGTLETLLTFPMKSRDIIIGKFVSVSFSSMVTGLLSLLLVVLSLFFAGDMFKIYQEVDLMLSPVSFGFAVLVIISYSFLISGLCIAVASRSTSFKEAQSTLTPLTFLSFFPGMIAFMMELKTTVWYALIPFLNYTLLFTDITNGTVNYLHLLLMILSTIVVIVVVFLLLIKQYKSEKILFSK